MLQIVAIESKKDWAERHKNKKKQAQKAYPKPELQLTLIICRKKRRKINAAFFLLCCL